MTTTELSLGAATLAPPVPAALTIAGPGLRAVRIGLDAGAAALTWAVVLLLAPGNLRPLATAALVAFSTTCTLVSLATRQLHREHVAKIVATEVTGCFHASVVATVAIALVDGRMGGSLGIRWPVYGLVLSLALLNLERSATRLGLRALRSSGRLVTPTLLIGASHDVHVLARHLEQNPADGYRVVGALSPTPERTAVGGRLGHLEDLESIVALTGATTAILDQAHLSGRDGGAAVRRLLDAGLHVQLASAIGLHHRRLRPTSIGHQPSFYVERVALTGLQAAIKRAIDLVIAGGLLFATAPVLAVAALAVKIHDGGPVLFRQRRVGLDGSTFTILKVRSMEVDAEAKVIDLRDANARTGPLFKLRDDPRVTRVGKVLRATSIDELPQLWNVVRGDMSLVGPRPALPSEVEDFHADLRRRHTVRPGITGMWQVEARDSADFEAYERHDLFYVENWSVLLDVGLLARTAVGIVHRAVRRDDVAV